MSSVRRALKTERVLFVINGLNRGGAETQLLRIAQEVQASGHEVAFAVLNPENDFAEQLAQMDIHLWAPSPEAGRWNFGHLLRLSRELKAWQPEVTVTFLFQATLFMRVLNLWLRPRRAISSMRNDQLESRLRSVLYRVTCAADDVIVVNSLAAAVKLQKLGTIPRSKQVQVIYNGIDADRVRSQVRASPVATRRRLGVSEQDVLLVGVGRLRPQKDWPALLRAVANAECPDLSCVIAGDGDLFDPLVQLSQELGVADRVRFLGLRDDVPDLMKAADYLVLCSRYEGTPNVVLEALALDLPAISTDVGACAELLQRPTDILVPMGDDTALTDALCQATRNVKDHRGKESSTASPATGMKSFAWSLIGQQWTDLVNGAAGSPDHGRALGD